MKQFEYCHVLLGGYPKSTDLLEVLNQYGTDGWQLVESVGSELLLFMREKVLDKQIPPV